MKTTKIMAIIAFIIADIMLLEMLAANPNWSDSPAQAVFVIYEIVFSVVVLINSIKKHTA